MPYKRIARKGRLKRLARYMCIGALACITLYAIGVNTFLFCNGIGLLFKSTATVSASYKRAYSVIPGVVQVRNLRVVFQDSNVQWSLDIDHAAVRITLTELLRRRFHVKWLNGSGVAFRFRHRIAPESRYEQWVSALPPIPEFPSPAVFEATVPEPPIPDSKYDLWTVHIENVDVSVRELWLQFVKYTGAAHASGSFRLVPARTLWVGPASLVLNGGQARFGSSVIASTLAGRVDCRVDFFDVRVPQGRDVLRYINTNIALRTPGFRIDPFVQFLERPKLAVKTDPRALRAEIHVSQGRIIPNTIIEYSADALQVDAGPFHFAAPTAHAEYLKTRPNEARLSGLIAHGEFNSSASIRESDAQLEITGDDLTRDFSVRAGSFKVGRLQVRDARAFTPLLAAFHQPITIQRGSLDATLAGRKEGREGNLQVTANRFQIQLESSGRSIYASGALDAHAQTHGEGASLLTATSTAVLDEAVLLAARPAEHTPVSGTLRHVAIDAKYDQEVFRRTLALHGQIGSVSIRNADQHWSGSKLSVHGKLINHQNHANGDVTLSSKSVRLGSKSTTLKLAPIARLTLRDFDMDTSQGKVLGTLDFSGWSASYGDDGGQCSSLVIPSGHFAMALRIDKGVITTRFDSQLRQVQAHWGKEFTAHADVRVVSHIAANRDTMQPRSISLAARLQDATILNSAGKTKGWGITAPEIRLGGIAAQRTRLVGALSVAIEKVTGHIGQVSVGASVDAQLPEFELSARRKAVTFGAQVRVRNADLTTNERKISNWWATINSTSTQLTFDQNLNIGADFHILMRDAAPGLMLMGGTRHLPSWLTNALPLGGVTGDGAVARRCRLTTIRFDRVSGGPLTARGALQSANDTTRGAFLVRLNATNLLSAGVEIGPPDAGVSPLVGDDWLRERTRRLDNAAEQILAVPCRNEAQQCAVSR